MAISTPGSIAVDTLQKQFALIDLSGEIRIVDKEKVASSMQDQSFEAPVFYKKPDAGWLMHRLLETLPLPINPKSVINSFWVDPNTTMYRGTAFSPKPTSSSALNFWVEPVQAIANGDCSVILEYLKNVICCDDPTNFQYLTGFLAHMVRKPEEKPGVMIVLLGKQGTGKGVFFNLLRSVWRQTTLQVTDVDQVIGRFNACLERNFIVCMDEALFKGDMRAMDRLKFLVTEPFIGVEQKYQPSRTIASVHRFFAASNHEHFAHVDMDDRRFVFLRVSDVRRKDLGYFARLTKALEDATCVGAFVHYLHSIDISSFEVRLKPDTGEHLRQKLKSLRGFDRYWYEVLMAGSKDEGVQDYVGRLLGPDPTFIPTASLVNAYISFNKNAARYETVQSSDVMIAVKKLCPSAAPGRQLWSENKFGPKSQKRGIQLPDLLTARADFEKVMGGAIQWD